MVFLEYIKSLLLINLVWVYLNNISNNLASDHDEECRAQEHCHLVEVQGHNSRSKVKYRYIQSNDYTWSALWNRVLRSKIKTKVKVINHEQRTNKKTKQFTSFFYIVFYLVDNFIDGRMWFQWHSRCEWFNGMLLIQKIQCTWKWSQSAVLHTHYLVSLCIYRS